MKIIEQEGKTTDEAIEIALKKLELRLEDVNVEIINEGNKGLFGLMGSKMAKVKITVENDPINLASKITKEILDLMNIESKVKAKEDERIIIVQIESTDASLIIGKRGQTLTALQEIVNLIINNKIGYGKKIVLDIEDYRDRRKETLIRLARKTADEVIRTRRTITLEPMNAYERHIIHESLQNHSLVSTTSTGNGGQRRVAISSKERQRFNRY